MEEAAVVGAALPCKRLQMTSSFATMRGFSGSDALLTPCNISSCLDEVDMGSEVERLNGTSSTARPGDSGGCLGLEPPLF